MPDHLQACHRFNKKESVIAKFKFRKLKRGVVVNKKNHRNISEHLCQLKFCGKFFILERMYHENHQLAYKARQLKNEGKTHSTWLWNNPINVKKINLSIFFILLTLKSFLAWTIWMILLATLHFKCFDLLLRCVFHYMFSSYYNNFL